MNDPTYGPSTDLVHASSTIAASAYYPSHELLTLTFSRGGQYSYRPVPYLRYLELVEAESIGKAFAALLKNAEGVTCLKGDASEFPL
jgi:hypothetical protein